MSELYHHGVVGMKWGVRRYQNEDGSLTDAGQKRYNKLYDANLQTTKKYINNPRAQRYDSIRTRRAEAKYIKTSKKLRDFEKNIDFDSLVRYKHGKETIDKYLESNTELKKLFNEIASSPKYKNDSNSDSVDKEFYRRVRADDRLNKAETFVSEFFSSHVNDHETLKWLMDQAR